MVVLLIAVAFMGGAIVANAQSGIIANPPAGGSGVIANPPGTGNAGPKTILNPLNVKSVGELLNLIINLVVYLAVIFAVLALIWVGFKFIAARGKPEKYKEAGRHLGYIVIGLAIILGARLIVSIVLATLEASGAVNPNVINSAENALHTQ